MWETAHETSGKPERVIRAHTLLHRRRRPSPTARPPREALGAWLAGKASGPTSKRSADTGGLWPLWKLVAETLAPCSFAAASRGTTANSPRTPPNTPAFSGRPEMQNAACGREPILSHRGFGEIALRGQERPQ